MVWSFLICDPVWHFNVAVFFLSCVVVAGLYGALTASKKIFFVQALPAIITLGVFLWSRCGMNWVD
jgi:putative membrane protein